MSRGERKVVEEGDIIQNVSYILWSYFDKVVKYKQEIAPFNKLRTAPEKTLMEGLLLQSVLQVGGKH